MLHVVSHDIITKGNFFRLDPDTTAAYEPLIPISFANAIDKMG